MTRRSLFLFALACALVLTGLATRNGSVVALAIPLLIYFAAGQLSRPDALHVSVTRSLSANKATPGTPVTVTLTVVNAGVDIDEAVIIDAAPEGLEVIDGEAHLLAALPSGQPVTLSYVVRGARGDFRFGQVSIGTNDAFALSQRQLAAPAATQLLILPETSKVRPIGIRPARTHGFAGPIPTRQAGAGSDFLAVRGYQPGDRLRRINWRVSARRPDRSLYTNTMEQQRIADVGLILDAREGRDVRIAATADGTLFEHSVQATGSLAEEFLRAGHRVGLLIYGGGGLLSAYPGYGRLQRQRILYVLGRAATGQHMFYENLKELPTRFFAAQSQLVFIGPAHPEDIPTLVALRARGYALIVVSPNAASFEMSALKSGAQTSTRALALRVALAERDIGIRQLRRHGVQVIDWDVRQPLEAAVASSLLRPSAQRVVAMQS